MGRIKNFFNDFKAFISKGNIFDMAIGVIIGSAFSPIVNSLVKDIIMPPLGLLIGDQDFSELKAIIRPEVLDTDGVTVLKEAVSINYGTFISYILNFLLVALVIFIVIRIITKSKQRLQALAAKKKAAEEAPAEESPVEEAAPVESEADILRDIRDLLANKNKEE